MTVGRLIFWRGDGDDDVKLVFGLLRNMVKYYGNNNLWVNNEFALLFIFHSLAIFEEFAWKSVLVTL